MSKGEKDRGAGPDYAHCPGCGHELSGDEIFLAKCEQCGRNLHQALIRSQRSGMLDESTGIRRRRRFNLGFRRIFGLPVESADPELGGQKKSRLEQQWLKESLLIWETPGSRRLSRFARIMLWITLVSFSVWLTVAITGWVRDKSVFVPGAPEEQVNPHLAFDESLSRRFAEAAEATRRFLQAGSVETLLPLVRDRSRVEPAIRAWYGAAPPFAARIASVSPHGAAEARGHVFVRMLAETEGHRSTAVTLEETADGWKADWESFVAWNGTSWTDLAEGRTPTQEPVLVRATLSFAESYQPPWSEEAHQSCELRSPHAPLVIPAWFSRDNVALMKLRGAMMDSGSKEIEVILRVRPALPGTVEITQIRQTGWVLWEGALPADGSLIFSMPPERK